MLGVEMLWVQQHVSSRRSNNGRHFKQCAPAVALPIVADISRDAFGKNPTLGKPRFVRNLRQQKFRILDLTLGSFPGIPTVPGIPAFVPPHSSRRSVPGFAR